MNIYKYKAKDGRKMAFMSIGFAFIFALPDFTAAAYVFDQPSLIFYGFAFRLIGLLIFGWFANIAYNYFRYMHILVIMLTIPSIIWAILTFYKAFGLFYSTIIIGFFIIGFWEIMYREKQKEYDYKKSAKELLKDYPKPITVKYKNLLDRYEKKKKKQTEVAGIEPFIIRFIPPWSMFALPGILGTFASTYLGFGGMVVGAMFATVILCLIFIGVTLDRYRYDYVFEEAQKILDENEKNDLY